MSDWSIRHAILFAACIIVALSLCPGFPFFSVLNVSIAFTLIATIFPKMRPESSRRSLRRRRRPSSSVIHPQRGLPFPPMSLVALPDCLENGSEYYGISWRPIKWPRNQCGIYRQTCAFNPTTTFQASSEMLSQPSQAMVTLVPAGRDERADDICPPGGMLTPRRTTSTPPRTPRGDCGNETVQWPRDNRRSSDSPYQERSATPDSIAAGAAAASSGQQTGDFGESVLRWRDDSGPPPVQGTCDDPGKSLRPWIIDSGGSGVQQAGGLQQRSWAEGSMTRGSGGQASPSGNVGGGSQLCWNTLYSQPIPRNFLPSQLMPCRDQFAQLPQQQQRQQQRKQQQRKQQQQQEQHQQQGQDQPSFSPYGSEPRLNTMLILLVINLVTLWGLCVALYFWQNGGLPFFSSSGRNGSWFANYLFSTGPSEPRESTAPSNAFPTLFDTRPDEKPLRYPYPFDFVPCL